MAINITKRDTSRHNGPLMEVHISVTKSSCQKVDCEFNQASSSNKQVTANTGTANIEEHNKHHRHRNAVLTRLQETLAVYYKCGPRTGQCWSTHYIY